MVEDEESKARRNFIAVSSLIVLAWWLRAPLDKISEKLLGMPSVGPEFEWRSWFAALIALAYFALRFRFSPEHTSALEELKDEFQQVLARLLKRWLGWEMDCFVRWGWTPPVMGDGFDRVVQRIRTMADGTPFPIISIDVIALEFGRRDTSGRYEALKDGEINGSVRLTVCRVAGNAYEAGDSQGIGFELSVLQRRLLKLWTASLISIYSKASTALFVPWALGSAAAVICLVRLVRAW